MNNTWVKLYRKSNDKGFMKDHLAWILFSWILINVDRNTGKMTLGRYRVCDELGINPSTYYKVLQRLEKKWHVITTQSTNKWTTLYVDNWSKYQHQENIEGKQKENDVELTENESNTLQEYKNKEIQEYTPSIVSPKKYSKLEEITEEVVQQIALDYNVPIGLVRLQLEKMTNWLGSKGKSYKNYNKALRNWVLDEAKKTTERGMQNVKYRSIDATGV